MSRQSEPPEVDMGDIVIIVVRVLAIVLAASIPIWIATRRARGKFRERFGRTPTDLELDSIGAWLKDPPAALTSQPTSQFTSQPPAQSRPTQSSSETSFGRDSRA
jgi:hypothetical protein